MGDIRGRANRTGKELERRVAELLEEFGYSRVSANSFFRLMDREKPIYARQCIAGKNIYDKDRRCDLAVYHPKHFPDCLMIQCKWQGVSGSVDEKYPFEVLSINANKYDTVIILDGGGYSPGAERWLKEQAGKDRLLEVMNPGQFQRFIRDHS